MSALITCHANADADAFSAMLAARRLYDNPILLFPGTQEANLARVYDDLDKELYNFVEPQSLDWSAIDELVVVDTRQRSRLKHVAPLLSGGKARIEIWDHHPPASDDVADARQLHFDTGAVASALCLELQRRDVALTPEEATLIGLGVYGDTGSFTYSSTKPEDFLAAAWLLAQGMDVNKINDMAARELTSAQVQALNSLLESARSYTFNNARVVLAETALDHYLGDFAYLAHKLMEMEKFTALFAIGIMGDRIQVVARSRSDAINVGEICKELGGGGHVYAASASVRSRMLEEVRELILRRLAETQKPNQVARDYMSSPAIGVEAGTGIRDADELMLHFGLKAVPVFKKGTRECVGLLDAQTAARASAHGLGDEKIDEYMQRRVRTLNPGASIKELSEAIVGERQRLIPIVEDGQVTGVVTRTDLINLFASESGNLPDPLKTDAKQWSAGKMIRERLPEATRKILELAGEAGSRLGLPVYAVGGFVRDLLADRPNHDIDLVAERDGIALARELALALGGRVREHQKFKTSVVVYHDETGEERHIDVATARLEYYEYPAALPTVEVSSIKMDLFRRDFSINALAVRLDGENFGQIIDFFGGRRDLKDGRVRVLHTLSFVEDPTRCVRAVRFEQRYKFRIGPGTEKLIKNMLPMGLLEKLSPRRLFNEFRLLCEEESACEILTRMDEIGILKALNPLLTLDPRKKTLLKNCRKALAWYRMLFFEEECEQWIPWFYALAHNMTYAESAAVYDSLGLPGGRKKEILRLREQVRLLKNQLLQWQKASEMGKGKVSELCRLLGSLSLEAQLYAMAAIDSPGLKKNISRYITTLKREKPDVTGHDLLRLGLKPGPIFSDLLRLALTAKLDGKAPNARRQLALIKSYLKKTAEKPRSALAEKADAE